MTNAEVFAQFHIRWNGLTPLLPEYASASTLTEATRLKASPVEPGSRVDRRGYGGSPRQYDLAHQQAVRALRSDGVPLRIIAERLEMPVSTVYHILQRVP